MTEEVSQWLRDHRGARLTLEVNPTEYDALDVTLVDEHGKTVNRASGWTIKAAVERLEVPE